MTPSPTRCSASANAYTARPQPLAPVIGVRKNPSAARGPNATIATRQPHSTMMEDTLAMFEDAAAGRTGEDALEAIGQAYTDAIASNPVKLQCQLVGYAACDNPEIRDVMRRGFGRLVQFVERVSGSDTDRVSTFFAKGMLLNVTGGEDLGLVLLGHTLDQLEPQPVGGVQDQDVAGAGLVHRGMFPCLRGGRTSRLVTHISSAWMSRGRVTWGSITSSM